jgi:hypothetical protein
MINEVIFGLHCSQSGVHTVLNAISNSSEELVTRTKLDIYFTTSPLFEQLLNCALQAHNGLGRQ